MLRLIHEHILVETVVLLLLQLLVTVFVVLHFESCSVTWKSWKIGYTRSLFDLSEILFNYKRKAIFLFFNSLFYFFFSLPLIKHDISDKNYYQKKTKRVKLSFCFERSRFFYMSWVIADFCCWNFYTALRRFFFLFFTHV